MDVNYTLLKLLHIFGGTIFIGNIIVTAFWKMMADRTREPKIAAFGQRLVNLTDFVFTSFGAFSVLITGMMMTYSFTEDLWEVRWVAWGLRLFLASAFLWAVILFPLQVKQAWLARSFSQGGEIPNLYWRLGRAWIAVAFVAVLLPLINLYFMVYKPT